MTHVGGEHGGVNARCSCLPNAKVSLLNATFQTVFAYIMSESGRTRVEHSSPPMTVGILHVFCMMENIDR